MLIVFYSEHKVKREKYQSKEHGTSSLENMDENRDESSGENKDEIKMKRNNRVEVGSGDKRENKDKAALF